MAYFDNAATSFPKPEIVYEKLNEATREFAANPGRSGHKLSLKMDRAIFNSRMNIAEFIGGTNPLNLIFTLNCTDSLNIAIKGLVKKGDHVITTSLEHNSVLRPLHKMQEDGFIDLTVVYADERGILDVKKVEEAITDKTRVCVTTAMSNLTGTIVDFCKIGEIMHSHGILYIVDAAQAMGYLDFDMKNMPIDVLCFPGHKSLFGPMGTGGLYIKEGIDVKSLKQGGTGSHSQDLEQPDEYPDRLESGTINGPAIYALSAGVDFIKKEGLENIRNHENKLKNRFIDSLKDEKGIILYGSLDENQGPVVPVNVVGIGSSQLAHILDDKYDIATRAGIHCAPLAHKTIHTQDIGAVRFSFGHFNTEEEVDKAIEALKEINRGDKDGAI
ncbi:MAG: aminotransferase class V-fold PLP-dependent enzyme [Finegoldia magna]|uniref:aminotransferase class V-fold PLP-dependent enzyme n=1 Tax=Finegoldia magna TaxID=1260 RepID=UPI0026EE0B71|nr:aminotransferase class V-fold PLP-dependent enzyme [Finegoldia magna]MBS5776835.1 aminotransferase class V-fold PLP-dependent enzyme [Finegoldia magna]MDU2574872.1 aminotransferase class V-fold PLP-dependent enzyme [Finegoldia magna]MDU7478716.1 aminotransferase class V-fold PLP-dependent enzyme [Finegoldia magna]